MNINHRTLLKLLGPAFIVISILIINDVTFSFAQDTKPEREQMMFFRSQRFGDWIMNCNALKSGKNETCSIKQELRTQKGASVLSIMISKSKSSKNPVAEFILPLGVHIPSGAWLKTDINSKKYKIKLTTCLQNGFRGEITIDKNLQKLLKKGKKATVLIYAFDNKKETLIPFSLKGFDNAFSKIK